MTNSRSLVVVVLLLCAIAAPVFAQDRPVAGRIKVSTGSAFIVRDGAQTPAQVGLIVFEADGLRTGADGKVGITLNDDTRLSLGPASEVRLERYMYAPGQGGFAMVLKFARGVAAYVSGRMAKLAPDAIRLETPSAIVGVRGTTVAIHVEQ